MNFTRAKMEKAMMIKSIMVWRNFPYAITTAGVSPLACLMVTARLEKSTPPNNTPIGGMMTSLTSELTIFPKAAPMMIPTAMSTTLPRMANFLNSDNHFIMHIF